MKKTFLSALCALSFLVTTACNNASEQDAATATTTEETQIEPTAAGGDQVVTSAAAENETEFSPGDPLLVEHIQQITDAYLNMKEALVNGNATTAKVAAERILSIVDSFEGGELDQQRQQQYAEKAVALKASANQLMAANTVDKQREYFDTISKAIYELNKTFEANENTLYYQYCPMAFNNKGAYWLSAEQEIRNPYFGDKMLKCGRVTETL